MPNDEISQLPLLAQIWALCPAGARIAWMLLPASVVALAAGELLRYMARASTKACRTWSSLAAKLMLVLAFSLMFFSMGGFVVDSGNSIDTPRQQVLENVILAQAQATMVVFRYFLPAFGVVLAACLVADALAVTRDGSAVPGDASSGTAA